MRDPNRIEPMVDMLKSIWNQYPDQRLGQLMSNVIVFVMNETNRDVFFVEDDEMATLLARFNSGNNN